MEFFPAEIESGLPNKPETHVGGGPVLTDYWWMNHYRRLDLVDLPNSGIKWSDLGNAIPMMDRNVPWQKWSNLLVRPPPAGESIFGVRRMRGHRFVSAPFLEVLKREKVDVYAQAIALRNDTPLWENRRALYEMSYNPVWSKS